MTDSNYKRFGKYLILDHLVDGGMAKICRARYLGEQANKIVAIKMVQPQYSKNPSFVQMFEDELKVTFGLQHPNIAQVYDYGLVDEQLYSAMEYVDGANLKQFLDRLKEKKFVFPVEISTYIISQVATALHYAHTYQDKLTGKSFNIIHRDISPHNIMITYDGAVKVIDFGIAKADSNSEETQAGTIKGKLSYLAPEYIDGLDLDHRYDQFAVGITLWEMLCSRKLFTAKNDIAVIKQIQACKVPRPSQINPRVPKELDEIVLKALSKDRNKRFENMDKLNRALVKFLFSNYEEFNATDLGYFAKQLFKEEITADRKKFIDFGKIDIKPHLKDLEQNSNNNSGSVESSDGSFISDEQRTGKIEVDLGDVKDSSFAGLELDFNADSTSTGIKRASNTSTKKIKRKTPASGDRTQVGKSRSRSGNTNVTRLKRGTQKTRVKSTSSAKTRARNRKDVKTSSSRSLTPLIAVAVSVLFVLIKPELAKDLTGIDFPNLFSQERNPASEVNQNKKTIAQESLAEVTFNNFDSDMDIYINNQKKTLNGITIKLAAGKTYAIKVMKKGYRSWEDPNFQIESGESYVSVDVPELEKFAVGYLSTSQNYTAGSVITYNVEGEIISKTLPLKNERIPAGSYDAVIKNPVLGIEQKVKFVIKENKRNFLK